MEAGAPDAARRRFKTQRGSKPGRGVWIAAMALVLAAAHVLKSLGAGWSGVVGSAAQQVHLAAASLVGHAAASGGSIAGGAGGEGGGAGGKGDGGGGEGGGDPELPCRESGYCSVGKLQAYVGEVDSTEGFKAMVRWRGAVVVVVGGGGGGVGGERGTWQVACRRQPSAAPWQACVPGAPPPPAARTPACRLPACLPHPAPSCVPAPPARLRASRCSGRCLAPACLP